MCFRPAVVKNICPQCGADNFPGATECFECGAELDGGHEPGSDAPVTHLNPGAAPAPGAPAAPAAPKPPATPGAPKPPAAPGAPKPPSA